MSHISIGELARLSECSVPTIRYYEEIGLIPKARRRTSGHRTYDAASARQLHFIRCCRDFGFSIEQVRELMALSQSDDRGCGETLQIAQAHLSSVRKKLEELQALEHGLANFVQSCEQSCLGGPAQQCTITRQVAAGKTPIAKCCG